MNWIIGNELIRKIFKEYSLGPQSHTPSDGIRIFVLAISGLSKSIDFVLEDEAAASAPLEPMCCGWISFSVRGVKSNVEAFWDKMVNRGISSTLLPVL